MVCVFSDDMVKKNKLLGNFGFQLYVYNKNLFFMDFKLVLIFFLK